MGSQLVLRIEFPSQMTRWEGLGIASPRGLYTLFLAKTLRFFRWTRTKTRKQPPQQQQQQQQQQPPTDLAVMVPWFQLQSLPDRPPPGPAGPLECPTRRSASQPSNGASAHWDLNGKTPKNDVVLRLARQNNNNNNNNNNNMVIIHIDSLCFMIIYEFCSEMFWTSWCGFRGYRVSSITTQWLTPTRTPSAWPQLKDFQPR